MFYHRLTELVKERIPVIDRETLLLMFAAIGAAQILAGWMQTIFSALTHAGGH